MNTVYQGQIVHTKSINGFEIFTDGCLVVDSDGKIITISNDVEDWVKDQEPNSYEIIKLTSSQFLMPGFIDCHIHAPQFAQIGLGLDKPLLDWLNLYTFPTESKYKDETYAKMVYENVVKTTVQNGTTLACYFATNHRKSSVILAKEVITKGQKGFIGKVCSDRNCPDFYVEETQESLEETKSFIEDINKLNNNLIQPILTPRFALTCTEGLLTGLAEIAKQNSLSIQSHISENLDEIKFVNELFQKSYAQAYYDTGILSEKTIMAHAVHLEDSEIELFKQSGTSIAHCPSSNTNLSSGLCDIRRILEGGVKVGLGTDISGGHSASIQDAILRCMEVSQHLKIIKTQNIMGTGKIENNNPNDPYIPIDYKQAIYLATLGGAEALSVHNETGNFQCGKDFDAILIETDLYPISNLLPSTDKTDSVKLLELIQKFIYTGDERNIVKVFVKGKQIK